MYLPCAFEDKMKELLQDEFAAYIACYDEPRYYGLRVNTSKISVEQFQKICPFAIEPIPWIENGFYYDGEQVSPAKHPYYFAGLYYLQEPSAMTPASRLPVEPGEKVLDICAAPGGKATELGAKLKGQGVMIANDISSSRAKGLLKNMELFGIGNMLVLSEEPGKLVSYFPEYFDKILIDAPCSGEGMFRKEKKMVKAWEEHGPAFFSAIQKRIIMQAAQMLKPGGMLLYSTCTFDGQENEAIIRLLLDTADKEDMEFEIIDMEAYEGFAKGRPDLADGYPAALEKTVRIFPHRMKGEGHYLALLKKNAGSCCSEKAAGVAKKAAKKLPQEFLDFFAQTTWKLDADRLDLRGERMYYMPENLPDLRGIRFLRTGLLLGELKKNRFEPSQALAMCLKKEEYRHTISFPVEDVRVSKYLKGETLDVADLTGSRETGWYLVCVEDYPLGFGKLLKGTLKNKYLPGWRLC